jgi:hypothetical protein
MALKGYRYDITVISSVNATLLNTDHYFVPKSTTFFGTQCRVLHFGSRGSPFGVEQAGRLVDVANHPGYRHLKPTNSTGRSD